MRLLRVSFLFIAGEIRRNGKLNVAIGLEAKNLKPNNINR